jgi:hypothetical protein
VDYGLGNSQGEAHSSSFGCWADGEKSAWQRQTLKFGHEEGDKYSSLIFDNRGSFATSINEISLPCFTFTKMCGL